MRYALSLLLPVLILTLTQISVSAQILNIDRENGQDTIPKKFGVVMGLDFASDKQQNDFVELSSSSEFDFFLKNDQLIVLFGQVDMAFNGNKVIENNGYFMARYRDNDTRRFYPDAYLQYQWNGILGMQSRALGGINGRLELFENTHIDSYTAIGVFYENELWDTELDAYAFDVIENQTQVSRKLFRLNTNFKMAFELSEKIDFAISHYLQFPMNESFGNFNQPRWFMDSDLFFEVNENISFNIHYDHTIDYYRALPIDKYYYNLNLGIQLSL
jgi:hypothetical protein